MGCGSEAAARGILQIMLPWAADPREGLLRSARRNADPREGLLLSVENLRKPIENL